MQNIRLANFTLTAKPKVWDFGRTLAGVAGSSLAGGHGYLSVVSDECCKVELSTTRQSLVQGGPTECVPY